MLQQTKNSTSKSWVFLC